MKVLCGIGGSDDSFRALDRTVERAAVANDDLTVAVVDNDDSAVAQAEVMERAREAIDDAGIDADVRRVEGDPGSRLVEIAEREEFEAIVLGGGHTSPMGKITLGPIAEFVLLNAKTSVTLVR
ncbi:universal stress protein UspA [Halorubrum sp. Ib24]|uniref:universal stress protein n=1 Tax=unclassified Halorubrum TaxID=2642239 RepID=UPI000B9877DD|nr:MULTISPECIES: universal stress protein [unclassified Halorubrum]OYR39405.1 universal stress protein UspA [Halorubrum sp. Ib24]OYR44629.1 universal stress protein UspA [Halorubrum sp. Eb13]OYR46965.1 universal stress protein UspA [Halorubrum sp. Hd13]OYR47978.1 universal stress protein UspA [Halorubrum sp. Ea8]OYR54213.1 universal stress protein UspA [Halorubrum sp. Ea1]